MTKKHYEVFSCDDDILSMDNPLDYALTYRVKATDAKKACTGAWRHCISQGSFCEGYKIVRVIRWIENKHGVLIPELEFDVDLHIDFDGAPHIKSISNTPSNQRHYKPTKNFGDEPADNDLTYKEGE